MEFIAVASTNIQGVAYDRAAEQLYVEFVGGARYRYDGVPPEEYEALMAAPSKGGYFSDGIKNSYPYARV